MLVPKPSSGPKIGKGSRRLATASCTVHLIQMLNVFSITLGVVALLLAIPSAIPFLGWGNWIVLPIAVTGAGLGALSNSNRGRNFCLIVLAIAVVRLMLGGGII